MCAIVSESCNCSVCGKKAMFENGEGYSHYNCYMVCVCVVSILMTCKHNPRTQLPLSFCVVGGHSL